MQNLLAQQSVDRQALFEQLKENRVDDLDNWHERSFLYLYHCGEDVLQVTKDAYQMYFMADRMAPSAFPSIAKYEREIVETILFIKRSRRKGGGEHHDGRYREYLLWHEDGTGSGPRALSAHQGARGRRLLERPPCVQQGRPLSGHESNPHSRVPEDFRADVSAMASAVNQNTILLAGSAPQFSQGVIDPISELGRLAQSRDLWLHVDGCMGGIMAPFVRKLGYPVPDYDFGVPGVSSISADLHKYGFSPKGVSVILYRDADLQKYQGFVWEDECEVYATPTFAASQPGGSVAAAWAALKYLGEPGFLDIARRTMDAKKTIVDGINGIPELELWVSRSLACSVSGRTLLT